MIVLDRGGQFCGKLFHGSDSLAVVGDSDDAVVDDGRRSDEWDDDYRAHDQLGRAGEGAMAGPVRYRCRGRCGHGDLADDTTDWTSSSSSSAKKSRGDGYQDDGVGQASCT